MENQNEVKETPEVPKEEPKFPSLEKGPALFYENDKHYLWLGIPFEKIGDPVFLMAAFDRAKFDALNYFGQYAMEMIRRRQLQVSPAGKRIADTMKGIFEKGKSLISH